MSSRTIERRASGPSGQDAIVDKPIVDKQDQTKVTISLPEQLWAELERRALARGVTRTEALRRAIWLYTFIDQRIAEGAEFHVLRPDGTDGTLLLSPY